MSIAMRSFAKINLGLKIGAARPDGFHELRTIYQTLALHDVVRVEVQPGSGIEIRCDDPRVPLDATNTCYKMAERVLAVVGGAGTAASQETAGPSAPLRSARDDKNNRGARNGAPEGAPLQSAGWSWTSTSACRCRAAWARRRRMQLRRCWRLERALGRRRSARQDELRIAAEVGSDLPLFLIGGTVLGVGRGEEVYPLPDLPTLHLVIVTPPIGVSTPQRLRAVGRVERAAARIDPLGSRRYNERVQSKCV